MAKAVVIPIGWDGTDEEGPEESGGGSPTLVNGFVYETENWYREGRGRTVQFEATDAEVLAWLLENLPAEFEPYSLVVAELVKVSEGDVAKWLAEQNSLGALVLDENGRFVPRVFTAEEYDGEWEERPLFLPLTQLLDYKANGHNSFFIRSHALTPELELQPGQEVAAICSLNGLPNLQFGMVWQGKQEPHSLGIVDQVVNDETNQKMIHAQYLQVYETLVNGLPS